MVKNTQIINFLWLKMKKKLSYDFCKHFFGVCYCFSHHCRFAFFVVAPLLLSIQYLNLTVRYRQPVRVVVFFHKIECVNMILRTLNLDGHQNCMIGSKVTTILPTFFLQKFKKLQT